jgi:glycosyltransferase involved in cell wall biosynthesis
LREVTFITNNLDIGGSQKVLINIANEALSNNYKVNIISLCNNLFLHNLLNKSPNLKLYTCTNKNYTKGLFNRLKLTISLFIYFFKHKPKLVHSHLWQIDIIYLILLRLFNNFTIIHTIHSPGSSYLKKNKIDYFNNKIESHLINNVKMVYITVVSLEIKEVIQDVLNIKKEIYYIPNAIPDFNLNKIDLLNKAIDGKKIFIYPARFQLSKGHYILIKAFKQVRDVFKDAKLILIGTGLKENLYESIISENLTDAIEIMEPTNDISKVLFNSNFGVMPSFYEGQSIALCEMMIMGLPIVASNIPSNVDITNNGKGAILCNVNSINSLKEKMIEIIKNRNLANSTSKIAREIILEKYSSNKIFVQYENLYLKCS